MRGGYRGRKKNYLEKGEKRGDRREQRFFPKGGWEKENGKGKAGEPKGLTKRTSS